MNVWGRYVVGRGESQHEVLYARFGRAVFFRGPDGPLYATDDQRRIVWTPRGSGERTVWSSAADGMITDNPCEEASIVDERARTVLMFDLPELERVTEVRHEATGRSARRFTWAQGQLSMTFDVLTDHLLRLESPSEFLDFQEFQEGSNPELRREMNEFLQGDTASG
ncbi:MAG: hypothetical protein ACTHLJ_07485 [Angustibacter sp.]